MPLYYVPKDTLTATSSITGGIDAGPIAYIGGEYFYVARGKALNLIAFNFAEGKLFFITDVVNPTLGDDSIVGVACQHTRHVKDTGPQYFDSNGFYITYKDSVGEAKGDNILQFNHEVPSKQVANYLRVVKPPTAESEDLGPLEFDGKDLYYIDNGADG